MLKKENKKFSILPRRGGKNRICVNPVGKKIKNNGFDANKHVFIELFAGMLSVCLNLNPKKAVLVDNEKASINFLNTIKNDSTFEKFVYLVKKITDYDTLTKEYFLKLRDIYNHIATERKQKNSNLKNINLAAYYFVLIESSFAGVYDEYENGKINPRYGAVKKIALKNNLRNYVNTKLKKIKKIREKTYFKNWEFICCDYRKYLNKKLKNNNHNLFFFVDPPYSNSLERKKETNFCQKKLAEIFLNLKHPAIMTNKYTDEIKDLYKDLKIDVYNKTNYCNIIKKQKYKECIIYNSYCKEK